MWHLSRNVLVLCSFSRVLSRFLAGVLLRNRLLAYEIRVTLNYNKITSLADRRRPRPKDIHGKHQRVSLRKQLH